MRITPRDLAQHIKAGKFENIYLFSGTEIGEKKEIISLIEKKLFPDSEVTKYNFYCGNDFDIVDFMNTLKSGLLFAEKKLVILKNIEDISSEAIKSLTLYKLPKLLEEDKFIEISNKLKNKSELLKKYYKKEGDNYKLSKIPPSKDKKIIINSLYNIGYKNYDINTYLIMMNESNDKIPQALLDILTEHQVITFWEMFDSQKKTWLRDEFKKQGFYIEENAINYILEIVENNKYQLKSEVLKISSLFKEKNTGEKAIKVQFIEDYLYHSKVETPFTLYSAMLEKNLQKSMDILESLFLTDEYSILNGVVWSHRRFIKALDLYENQGMPVFEIFSFLHITNKKNKDDFNNGFKHYKFYHAAIMFSYLQELDYYIKVLPHELKLVKLQEFVINFVNGDYKRSFLKGPITNVQG